MPEFDPITGEPIKGDGGDPDKTKGPETVTIPKEEFDAIKTRLDAFDQRFNAAPTPEPAPSAPAGPTLQEQIADIDKELDSLDDQIDAAISEQKPIKALNRKRSQLHDKRMTLRIQHDHIEPIRQAGFTTLNHLTDEVTRGQMEHLKIPEIEKDYKAALSQLPPDQQMLPDVRKWAYNAAVGKNSTKLVEAAREEALRSVAADQNLDPAGKGSRSSGKGGDPAIPNIVDVLGEGAMQAIKEKGISVDVYYQRQGYEGWEDYYTKNKEYIMQ